ncbi:hypothetical protein ACFWQL_26925 [Amycolatopsis thermoflava]|uniref:hypothetical protein n=1 Tax=Amycolatopsis thermoflava TaxID=84480 RepID=UPI00364A8419
MKIIQVDALPVSTPLTRPFLMPGTRITDIHSVLLKITTDDGIVGVADCGDTSTWYRGETQDSIIAMICDHIAPRFLIGADPRDIEHIVGRMDTFVRDNNQAKALVDFALHDLKGKAFGVRSTSCSAASAPMRPNRAGSPRPDRSRRWCRRR